MAAVVVDRTFDGAQEPAPEGVVEAPPEPLVPLETRIERALYRADTVLSHAKRTGDTTGLGSVVADPAYRAYADEIAGFRRNGLYQVHTLSDRRMKSLVRLDSTTVEVQTTLNIQIGTYHVADDSCYRVYGPFDMEQTITLKLEPAGWRISTVDVDEEAPDELGPRPCS